MFEWFGGNKNENAGASAAPDTENAHAKSADEPDPVEAAMATIREEGPSTSRSAAARHQSGEVLSGRSESPRTVPPSRTQAPKSMLTPPPRANANRESADYTQAQAVTHKNTSSLSSEVTLDLKDNDSANDRRGPESSDNSSPELSSSRESTPDDSLSNQARGETQHINPEQDHLESFRQPYAKHTAQTPPLAVRLETAHGNSAPTDITPEGGVSENTKPRETKGGAPHDSSEREAETPTSRLSPATSIPEAMSNIDALIDNADAQQDTKEGQEHDATKNDASERAHNPTPNHEREPTPGVAPQRSQTHEQSQVAARETASTTAQEGAKAPASFESRVHELTANATREIDEGMVSDTLDALRDAFRNENGAKFDRQKATLRSLCGEAKTTNGRLLTDALLYSLHQDMLREAVRATHTSSESAPPTEPASAEHGKTASKRVDSPKSVTHERTPGTVTPLDALQSAFEKKRAQVSEPVHELVRASFEHMRTRGTAREHKLVTAGVALGVVLLGDKKPIPTLGVDIGAFVTGSALKKSDSEELGITAANVNFPVTMKQRA